MHPGSFLTVGVSHIGTPSADNFGAQRHSQSQPLHQHATGTHRGQANRDSVGQSVPWNVCLKPQCVSTGALDMVYAVLLRLHDCMTTVQLENFKDVSISYNTSSIDGTKSVATLLHHQLIVNDGPSTVDSTVSGSTKVTQAMTMTFSETITDSFTIAEKIAVQAQVPQVATFSEETTVRTYASSCICYQNNQSSQQVTEGFTFQFAEGMSATTTAEQDLTLTVQVSVPPFSNITADVTMYSQVRTISYRKHALSHEPSP